MDRHIALWLGLVFSLLLVVPLEAQEGSITVSAMDLEEATPLSQIIQALEARYSVEGFSADFDQESTLKAMDITDTASGRLYVKRPGMMRWEYDRPERQIIVSDGISLWIYRPDDNQVFKGRAPAVFGDGKGASFLADIGLMRRQFDIHLESGPGEEDHYLLRLRPHQPTEGLREIFLRLTRDTYDVVEILTVNMYDDETRIALKNIRFQPELEDRLFNLTLPEGVDVQFMEE